MILIDYNQVCIASAMVTMGGNLKQVDENLFRHIVLNVIRSNLAKFRREYGENIVIASDGPHTWRKNIFPYYKANRKKTRQESDLDWSGIFNTFAKIREELRENFPYRVIHLEGAEADDVIATLCHRFGKPLNDGGERILILSGDKDFSQLQKYANVDQYDPVQKKKIVCSDPALFLREHIIRGDQGDGVPNIMSNDDTFVRGSRQAMITSKRLGLLMEDSYINNDVELKRNYIRNKTLIDLDEVPESLRLKINTIYDEEAGKDRSKIFNYFFDKSLKNLMEEVGAF